MIIGKGDIASILNDRVGALFFASGVSNSGKIDSREYQREMDLLMAQNKNLCCIYFSSISVATEFSRYLEHKKMMEQLVRDNFENHCIIRIGNIDWGDNPNTFINFIQKKIKNNEHIEIRDELKYMISKEQLLLITDNIPLTCKNEINVFGVMGKVSDFI